MTTLKEKSLKFHNGPEPGKIEIISSKPLKTKEDLSLAYTPGVIHPCLAIKEDPDKAWDYTIKGNTIAIATDGSRILGLGNIGPLAGLPVMEGKALLFKMLGGVNAIPLCIKSSNSAELIETIERVSPMLGGVNLEDIRAPTCFEVEKELTQSLDVPVFHDDQHGTAVVTLAGLINSLKVVGKKLPETKITVNGAGAAGIGITKLLLDAGAKNVTVLDSKGALHEGRRDLNEEKEEVMLKTNPEGVTGDLNSAVKASDVFIGVSAPGALTKEMVKSMNDDAIVFALANPDPEISVENAKLGGARIVGTGSSKDHNQVNNVLAFPGIFRGLLDCRASKITSELKVSAARAISELVTSDELREDYVIPEAMNPNVAKHVALSVVKTAMKTGVARKKVSDLKNYEERVQKLISHYHGVGTKGYKPL